MSLARFFSHLLTFAFLLLASHAHASVINDVAFDPASNNLIDTNQRDIQREESGLALETEKHTTSKLLDNLLKDYAGTHYRHDERGNLVEKITNGERIRYQWNASNQLTKVETADTVTQFRYDPLGRRIIKHSAPVVPRYFDAGRQYRTVEAQRLSREKNLGTTFYGWDGDTLAWETTNEESTHYFYEPDSFVPLAQGVQNHAIQLHPTPDWTDREYSLKEDPLWTQVLEPEPFDKLGFYHCDHLGTPQEMTDEEGNIAWQAQYKAWGEAKEIISKAAQGTGFKNPLRFQGQYFDHETGLHYNRFRYYDPETGRFISKDPIRYAGGMNLHVYAPNPIEWVDPLGLQIIRDCKTKQCRDTATGRFVKCTAPQQQAPDFIVSPGGTAFPVPKGATGPTPVINPAGKQTGIAYTGGSSGENGQVATMRVMDATPAKGKSPGYPNGYIKYENSASPKPQGVDPYTGKTLPNSQSHFPID